MIESKGHKITLIDGDLAVSRNAEVGGDADIHGKARVAGNMKVEGFLDAPNIKGAVKGLFATEEELKREYPNPRLGWCAIVLADKESGFLYLAKNREWEKQSKEAKPFDFIVDSINVFASKSEIEEAKRELSDAISLNLKDINNEVARATKAENDIKAKALKADTVHAEAVSDSVKILGKTLDGTGMMNVTLPSSTTESAGVMSMEDKNVLFDINLRLGHGAETIVLKASDLIPMTWNGTKMVSSTNYNVWIVPLNEGVQYSAENTPFMQSKRTCSEYPALDKELAMTMATKQFIATSEMKYLVITVTMSAYDGSDYSIEAGESGLTGEINTIKRTLTTEKERVDVIKTELSQTKRELNACIGAKDRTIVLTSDDFDNIIWNGTSFVNANKNYNGFVVPIYPGERIRYTAPQANNVCTLTNYPTIGSSERVRTRTDFNDVYAKGDFIVQDNEHYLFLNTTVATHDSYEVVGGKGALNVQLDGLRELQNPLNGKTIVCFGDSLTEFNGEGGKGYGDYLAELSGAKVVRGGIGGTQLATRREPVETIPDTDIAYQHAYGAVDISNLVKAWANNDWAAVDNAVAWLAENKNDDNSAVIERLKNCPIASTDVVIVFGGSNDLNNGTYGKPDDTNPLQNTCGGINQIIDSILSVKPDMTIYFFTPIPRMATSEIWCDDYRTDQSDAHGSLSFPSLVKRIKECVEYNHIPCCDMYHTIGINRKNIYTYARDGVHVTGAFRRIANRIYGFIMENRIWN